MNPLHIYFFEKTGAVVSHNHRVSHPPLTPHSIVASFCTTIMSDPVFPLESRLEGKFKAPHNRLSDSRPFDGNLSAGLRLGFTSASVRLMLTRSLQGVLRLQKAQFWCMSILRVKQILLLILHGTPECITGSSQLHGQGF